MAAGVLSFVRGVDFSRNDFSVSQTDYFTRSVLKPGHNRSNIGSKYPKMVPGRPLPTRCGGDDADDMAEAESNQSGKGEP